jgi:hypothetical protein
VELLVTFREGDGTKIIKIPFLVIDYTSLYNCIIEMTGLAQLWDACSTSHLKLKYHAVASILSNHTQSKKDPDALHITHKCFLKY